MQSQDGPVRILPHHATSYFEAFYLGRKPEDIVSWYDNSEMRQNGVEAVRRVISSPKQMVRVVDSYDEFCRMCPRNEKSKNYNGDKVDTCHTYDVSNPDAEFVDILGLREIANGQPVTAKRFFDLMRPTYERLLAEDDAADTGKQIPLRQIFRFKPKYSFTLTPV